MKAIPVGTLCLVTIRNPTLIEIATGVAKYHGTICTVTGPMDCRDCFVGKYFHPVQMSDGVDAFCARVALTPLTPPPGTKIDEDIKHDELETI